MHYSLVIEYRSLYRLDEKDKQADHVTVPYGSTVTQSDWQLQQQLG